MKAEELMVGDWLQNPLGLKGRVRSIKYIPKDYADNYGGYFLLELVFSDESAQTFPINDAKPIPLTPEILEKNGFKMHPTMHFCEVELGNHRVTVQFGYANRVEYVRIRELGMDRNVPSEKTSMYLPHVRFYHELQHCLKLCGIDKTIEL